jgi:hypothetical protein
MPSVEDRPEPAPAAGRRPLNAGAALEQIVAARSAAAPGGELDSTQILAALTLLRELRTEIAAWEPDLIDAARALGTSWNDLAPALGVASRQAAERRYLRLRPATDGRRLTGDQRVRAERDVRAGDRAVRDWARANAAGLRQLAGQVGALGTLPGEATAHLDAVRQALGHDDAADLVHPLAQAGPHLRAGHPDLAGQIGDVARHAEELRQAARDRR